MDQWKGDCSKDEGDGVDGVDEHKIVNVLPSTNKSDRTTCGSDTVQREREGRGGRENNWWKYPKIQYSICGKIKVYMHVHIHCTCSWEGTHALNATPPLAWPSSLVTITEATSTFSLKALAWASHAWPILASITYTMLSGSWGKARIMSMRILWYDHMTFYNMHMYSTIKNDPAYMYSSTWCPQ